MTTTKKFLLGSSIALVGVLIFGAVAMAQGGLTTKGVMGFGKGMGGITSTEDQKAVQDAISKGDYTAWKNLMTKNVNNIDKFSEERFEQMVTRDKTRKAVEAAMEKSDYTAWVAAVTAENKDNPILQKITKDNFSELVKVHTLMTEAKAKMEEAKVIKDKLGISGPGAGFGGEMMGRGGKGEGRGGKGGHMMGGFGGFDND